MLSRKPQHREKNFEKIMGFRVSSSLLIMLIVDSWLVYIDCMRKRQNIMLSEFIEKAFSEAVT